MLLNLFAEGGTLELKQENHERVSEARTNHRLSLKERYTSGFFNINGGWHFLGIVLSILLALPALLLPGKTDIWPEWHFTTAARLVHACSWCSLMLVANGVFGKLLKAPTVAGQAAMDHIRGFKMYLEVAEGEELKRVKAPPPPHDAAALRILSTGGAGARGGAELGRAFRERAQRAGAQLRARVVCGLRAGTSTTWAVSPRTWVRR